MDICKYRRGMVFIVYEPEEITNAKINNRDRTIVKTRPYVLLSSNAFMKNERNVIFIAAPISSKTEFFYEGDIKYEEFAGDSKICLNNTKAIDRKNIREYLFTLSDDVMDEIDRTLSDMLGLSTTKHESLPEIPVPVKEEDIVQPNIAIDFFDHENKKKIGTTALIGALNSGISENANVTKKGSRIFVAIKDKEKFIQDFENMTTKDVTKLYGFNSRQACKAMYDRIKKQLAV